MKHVPLIILAPLALGACADLLSTPYDATETSFPDGIPYNMTKRVFTADVTETLAGCEYVSDATTNLSFLNVQVKQEVVVKSELRPDKTFVIPFDSVGGVTKTTKLDIKRYDTGALKSINVAIEDRTAQVVANTLGAGLGIARMALGLPGGGGGDAKSLFDEPKTLTTESLCGREALAKLQKAKELTEALKDANTKLTELQTKATGVTNAVGQGRGSAADNAKAKTESTDEIDAIKKTILVVTKKLAEVNASLVYTKSATIEGKVNKIQRIDTIKTSDSGESSKDKGKETSEEPKVSWSYTYTIDEDIYPPAGMVDKWLSEEGKAYLAHSQQRDIFCPAPKKTKAEQASIEAAGKAAAHPEDKEAAAAAVVAAAAAVADKAAIATAKAAAKVGCKVWPFNVNLFLAIENSSAALPEARFNGVLVREPAFGTLMACTGSCVVSSDGDYLPPVSHLSPASHRVKAADALFAGDFDVPQAGRLVRLPLHNGTFENNALAAEFSPSNVLLSVTYSTASQAEAASKALLDTVNATGKFVDARNAARAAAEAAPLATLKSETALINAKKDNLDALLGLKKSQDALAAAGN